MKVYVVMEIGWEYNDENYFRPESEGGTPKVAYESQQDARIACAEMNAKKLALPRACDMVTGWHRNEVDSCEGEFDVIEEYFEVKEVELVNE